ncbi:hypothetical protein D9M69_540040 [compost metagenome]
MATNSSSHTGITLSERPAAGSVTSARSMLLSSTLRTCSSVLPVLTTTLSAGKASRSWRSTEGKKYRQAVAPVPSRTRPVTPRAWSASASTAFSTAASICGTWRSSSAPAGVARARLPTRSMSRTASRRSSWRTCRLTAGCDRPSRSAAAEKLPVSITRAKVASWSRLRFFSKVFLMRCIG